MQKDDLLKCPECGAIMRCYKIVNYALHDFGQSGVVAQPTSARVYITCPTGGCDVATEGADPLEAVRALRAPLATPELRTT